MVLYYILMPLAWLVWHIGFRIRVEGRENLKKVQTKGYILAPTHVSAIDPVFIVVTRWGRRMVVFAKKELYFCSLMRLAVIPLCMVGLFYLCGVRGDLLIAMVISASAPTATNTAMYAAKYDNDAALGSELAAQSSLFSIVTMPVVVALAAVI